MAHKSNCLYQIHRNNLLYLYNILGQLLLNSCHAIHHNNLRLRCLSLEGSIRHTLRRRHNLPRWGILYIQLLIRDYHSLFRNMFVMCSLLVLWCFLLWQNLLLQLCRCLLMQVLRQMLPIGDIISFLFFY